MTGKLRSILGATFVAAVVTAVAYGQVAGSVTGVVSGPGGPIANLTVNAVNAAGQVIGTAVTDPDGRYTVGTLPAGTYTIQVVTSSGAVLATSTGTVSATAAAATVNVSLTASQLAAAGVAAGGGGGGGLSTKAILGIVAATGAGIATVVAISDDPSATQ